MQLDLMELVGILAGCCTTASFLPQVVQSWRTKSVGDISLRMYLLLVVGMTLWLAYGIHLGSLSIILANAVSLTLTVSILCLKLRYGSQPVRKKTQ